MAKSLFVAGTDTDVGKTLVSAGLLKALAASGYSTTAIKPVAAGCKMSNGVLHNSDALILQRETTVKLPYSQVNPVALREACAPHIAAAKENRRLDLARLEGFCRGVLMHKSDVCVIEGAGGWRVPLNNRQFLSDLPKALNASVVLVVGMKLGCLNHALLSAEAISRDGLKLAGWVANCIDPNMVYMEENVESLMAMLPAPCLGVVPFLSNKDEQAKILHVSQLLKLPSLNHSMK